MKCVILQFMCRSRHTHKLLPLCLHLADRLESNLLNVLFCFPGDYEVSVKFNDEHIPDSPFVVPVGSTSDDARRLTVSSLQVRHWEKPQPLMIGQRNCLLSSCHTDALLAVGLHGVGGLCWQVLRWPAQDFLP